MKIQLSLLLLLIGIVFNGCKDDDDSFESFPDDAVTYQVTFTLNWNSTDFPTDYPSNAHFSPLIGWSHQSGNTFFQTGSNASAGIENMAETGETSPLDDEIKDRITQGEGLDRVIGDGLGDGVGEISVEVVVSDDFPLVTLATMLAPSPDWYAAVVGVNLLDGGEFVDEKTVEALVYDAGTDDGATFTSDDADSNPQQAISLFVDTPLGNGSIINPAIATVKFEKR